MESTLWLKIYRTLATLFVLSPIALNWLLAGSILSALIYTPLVSLLLMGLAIWFDSVLVHWQLLTKRARRSKKCSIVSLILSIDANSKASCCL